MRRKFSPVFFVASFVPSFVDKAHDKARDKVEITTEEVAPLAL
jgi:hypothetical protein